MIRPVAVSCALLGLALLPQPAAASLPEQTCFALAMQAGAVDDLRFRVRALSRAYRAQGVAIRSVHLHAMLGRRGQGLRDGVAGKLLTQELVCDIEPGICTTPDGRATLTYSLRGDALSLTLRDLPVGDFGNSMLLSNLADPVGAPLVLNLVRVTDPVCDTPPTPIP